MPLDKPSWCFSICWTIKQKTKVQHEDKNFYFFAKQQKHKTKIEQKDNKKPFNLPNNKTQD